MLRLYTPLLLVLLVGLANSCNNASEIDRKEVAATNFTDMPNDSVRQLEYNETEQWMNEYISANPDITFHFTPADTGSFNTVAGNYTVVADNVANEQDQDEVYNYFRMKYDNRLSDRNVFNEGIDKPAAPEAGYPEYLSRIESSLNDLTYEGTVFVDLLIDKNGSIDNAQIVEESTTKMPSDSVSSRILQSIINAEAKWSPAEKEGQPTSMRIEIPLTLSDG